MPLKGKLICSLDTLVFCMGKETGFLKDGPLVSFLFLRAKYGIKYLEKRAYQGLFFFVLNSLRKFHPIFFWRIIVGTLCSLVIEA